MITPRDYQQAAIDKVIRAWQSPLVWKHTTVGIAPTGSGKSIIALSACKQYMQKERRAMRVLIVAHTIEIVRSLYKDAQKYGFRTGVGLVNGTQKTYWRRVTIATVQSMDDPTIMSKVEFFGGIDLLIIDEAHRGVTATHLSVYRKLKKMNPDLKVLGMTATYERSDLRGLRELFTHCAFKIQPNTLIRKGHLAKPFQTWRLLDHDEPGYVIHRWWKAAKGKRKTLIFARDIAHAKEFVDTLDSLGMDVSLVTGDTPAEQRREAEQAHIIVNVGVYKEGANVPGVSCVIIARNSHETPWRQMLGRGMRPDSKDCLVLSMNRYKLVKRIPFFVLGIPKPTTFINQVRSSRTFTHRLMSYTSG